MAEIVFREVSKFYGDSEAVKSLNLTCADGEFTCLLGPSGCGKSSSLRMVAGLEKISKGEIYIGKNLVNDMLPKDRNIAMVFETYALYPHLKVYDNIAFPLKVRNFSKTQIAVKVKHVSEMLDMKEFLQSRIKGLGDGQKQRVSIARALVREPEVFLMDEPISHLDAKLRARMRGELKRIQRETKTTCIYVTHDQIEAMALGDKIAIMNFGILQQVGTPEQVFDHPASEFVAGFIGEPPMNFFDCEVVRENGELFFVTRSFKIDISAGLREVLGQKSIPPRIRLGMRPMDIKVSPQKIEPHGIAAKVYTIEPQGDSLVLTLKAGEDLLRVESTEKLKISPGDTLWWNPRMEKVYLFDKSTGVNLV